MQNQQPADEELVRDERFQVPGKLDIEVSISTGSVALHLAEPRNEDGSGEATVELRHDPSAGAPWTDGMNAMLSWVGEHFAEQFGTDLRASPADAIGQTRVEQVGGSLVVSSPSAMPARNVPLAVTVHAPTGSQLNIRTSTGDVTVTGDAGQREVSTGSGGITIERAAPESKLRTGSGSVKLGAAPDGLNVRTGSGDTEIRALGGSAGVVTGSGAVWLGETTGEVLARTGSGNIAVADARSGTVELSTGSGDLRIGIGSGVLCELDVSSGSGRALSELDVADEAPEQQAELTVHARTGTGNAIVRRSAA